MRCKRCKEEVEEPYITLFGGMFCSYYCFLSYTPIRKSEKSKKKKGD